MFSKVSSGAVLGINGQPVSVEADISSGFPSYTLVGYLGSEVKEARERVTTALRNSGYFLPAKRIVVNLSPAGIRKQGTAYDLPIALSILSSLMCIPQENLNHIFVIGELGLDGSIKPVRGILSLMMMARDEGMKGCLIPAQNLQEAQCVHDLQLWPVESLKEAVDCLNKVDPVCKAVKRRLKPGRRQTAEGNNANVGIYKDFVDIQGQEMLKRAALICASGMHHRLMVGPPGSGKSMCAERIPGILPPLSYEEAMEVTKIYSVAGLLGDGQGLMTERPFRTPHHTASARALTGGGRIPVPGEVSLAHHGILFLDEMAEFLPSTLDVLRQPLESGQVVINRVSHSYRFPAGFVLVGAANPCKCGYFPDRNRCRCTIDEVNRYMQRISRPLLDRMDLCVDVKPAGFTLFNKKEPDITSETMREKVLDVWHIQTERFMGTGIYFNSRMTEKMIEQFCPLEPGCETYMRALAKTLDLSARGCGKLMKVARTIADLDHSQRICEVHLSEAACFRLPGKQGWGFEHDESDSRL